MIRTPIALVPYLIALAAIIAGLLSYAGDRAAGLAQGVAAVGGPFTLVDQDGRTRTDKDFRGQYLLIYFGYTYCPDVCPTTLAVMEQALEKLGPAAAARVTPVFVTIDPVRDTPQVLKPYLKSFGPRFVGLTGSEAAITLISHEYSVYAAKQPIKGGGYAMNHSSTIYLMGPNGKFVTHYEESIGPDGLAADLRKRI